MKPTHIPPSPVHFLSAFVTVLLDWVWLALELPATLTGPGLILVSLALGLLGFLVVLLIERYVVGQSWGSAAARDLAMGVTAGVPYPVVGMVMGGPLLIWVGLHEAGKSLPPSKESDTQV